MDLLDYYLIARTILSKRRRVKTLISLLTFVGGFFFASRKVKLSSKVFVRVVARYKCNKAAAAPAA